MPFRPTAIVLLPLVAEAVMVIALVSVNLMALPTRCLHGNSLTYSLARVVPGITLKSGNDCADFRRLEDYAGRSRCDISITRARAASSSTMASALALLAESRLASHPSSR